MSPRAHRPALSLPLAALALAAAALACSDPQARRPSVGDESFLSQPPGGLRTGATAGGADAAAPPGAGAPTTSNGGTATPQRAIEEADIYRLVGARLYVLNPYRGLELVDLTDLAAPRLAGRVPITGTPVDLYVHGTVAFVTVRDVFTYVPTADDGLAAACGSRFLAVDFADPAHPAVLADLPIAGEVQQTRIVGDVLYVVSHLYWWYAMGVQTPSGGVAGGATATDGVPPGTDLTYVQSFDVSDPARPVAVARLELPVDGWDLHVHVSTTRVTVALSGWDPGSDGQLTRFQAVDISDPGGALVAGAAFETPGQVMDRWSMDHDAARGLFRAVVALGWNQGAALQTWTSPSAGEVTPLSRLAVPVEESLTAARLDGDRVYLVTAVRTDPLWTIDASDPAHPALAGALQMPGQLDFIAPRGDRLVALGHTSEAGQPFQLAVSLLDVSALARPQLLSRVVFGAGIGWVAAQRDDLAKAFIVLDPPPAGIGLVLVPVQGWDPATYRSMGGTQLVDLARDALTLRGFLAHPGAVVRSFPADAAGETLVAFSDTLLQTIDARDRDAPAELGRIDLARWVQDLVIAHGHAIELAGDWWRGGAELVVTDAATPDATPPLARLDVAAPWSTLLRDGDVLWLLAHDWNAGTAWLQAVDVSDPLHPTPRGRLELPASEAPYVGGWWWGGGAEVAQVGHVLAVHRSPYLIYAALDVPGAAAAEAPVDEVRLYDLSDPDHPRRAGAVALPGAWAWGLQAHGAYLWVTHFVWDGDSAGRYLADRIDPTDPDAPGLLASVNVPGVLVGASDDGRRLFTLDTWWTGSETATAFDVLELTAEGRARLVGSAALPGYPSGVAVGATHAWVATSDYGWSRTSATLLAIDLGDAAVTSRQPVQGSWTWVRKAAGGKLFLQAGWSDQGLLVYDLADPARPAFQQFYRTQGWISDVVVEGGVAYLPSGPYGVPMIDLQ